MPQRGLRELKKRATDIEPKLFAAAMRAFSERGYADVSLDDLARAVRATKPMVHYYFGSKAKLYRAVVHEAFAVLRRAEQAADAPERGARERLERLVRADFAVLRERPEVGRILYRTAYAQSPAAPAIDHWALFFPGFQQVMDIVLAGQREGLIVPGPPPKLALPLFGLIGIFAQVHLAGPLGEMLDDHAAADVVELYLGGVGAGATGGAGGVSGARRGR
jgi:AcrR family transcriptional regulator